jgi:ABC-type nitrate/sulfonate/bicarbonate transport system ATPase subunit
MNIIVKNVSFAYSAGCDVLKNVSFEVPHNSVVGILGSSGSGKSTLLRVMLGLLPSAHSHRMQGEVKLECSQTLEQLRRRGKIALMFQEPSLLPNLSVEQNVLLPLRILERENERKQVEDLISSVGLEQFRHFLPKHLSGGMQTRTALARTFVTQPELLFLDEPFTGLDYGWRLDLYRQLTELMTAYRSTAVIVSHDIHEVLLLADKVLLLSKDGRLISTTDALPKRPASFSPQDIAVFFDSVEDEVIGLQNELVRERHRELK